MLLYPAVEIIGFRYIFEHSILNYLYSLYNSLSTVYTTNCFFLFLISHSKMWNTLNFLLLGIYFSTRTAHRIEMYIHKYSFLFKEERQKKCTHNKYSHKIGYFSGGKFKISSELLMIQVWQTEDHLLESIRSMAEQNTRKKRKKFVFFPPSTLYTTLLCCAVCVYMSGAFLYIQLGRTVVWCQ